MVSIIETNNEQVVINYGKILRAGAKAMQVGLGVTYDAIDAVQKDIVKVGTGLQKISDEEMEQVKAEFYEKAKDLATKVKDGATEYWEEFESMYREWEAQQLESEAVEEEYIEAYKQYKAQTYNAELDVNDFSQFEITDEDVYKEFEPLDLDGKVDVDDLKVEE